MFILYWNIKLSGVEPITGKFKLSSILPVSKVSIIGIQNQNFGNLYQYCNKCKVREE